MDPAKKPDPSYFLAYLSDDSDDVGLPISDRTAPRTSISVTEFVNELHDHLRSTLQLVIDYCKAGDTKIVSRPAPKANSPSFDKDIDTESDGGAQIIDQALPQGLKLVKGTAELRRRCARMVMNMVETVLNEMDDDEADGGEDEELTAATWKLKRLGAWASDLGRDWGVKVEQ